MTAPRYGDRLSFAEVPDIEAPGAFDQVVKNIDGVIHTASPFHYPVENNEEQLLRPSVNGTLRILEAVHASGNSRINRVVITSSFAAVVDTSKGNNPGKIYTEGDWNPMTWDEAKVAEGSVAYCASKTFAEKAAWDFVERKKPAFSVSTVCPPMVYGPIAQYIESINKLNKSSSEIWNLINGSQATVPPTSFPAFSNVVDLARAHKFAFERESAANRRFLITTGPFTYQDMCNILRSKYPQLKDKVPEGKPNDPLPETYRLSHERATEELGMTWTSLEDTLTAAVDTLLSLEQKSDAST